MNEHADVPVPSLAHAGRLGCACHGRRGFTALLLGTAAGLATVPAAAQSIPECKRSRAAGLIPASQLEGAAQQQYAQMMREASGQNALAPASHPQVVRLRYIAQRMIPFTASCNERAAQWKWEVNLLGSKQINAFCMPGGKIAFFSAILSKLQLSDDETAMIMGHEIAHALLEHARERMAKSTGTQLLLRGGAALLGLGSLGDAAAQGASQLLSLRFSRDDESEADRLGLVIAARAGYDPRAGVTLWQKMGAQSGGSAPPPWLSTHPAGETRIRDIQGKLPAVLPTFNTAPKPDRQFGPPKA